jgi:hypothetical protein
MTVTDGERDEWYYEVPIIGGHAPLLMYRGRTVDAQTATLILLFEVRASLINLERATRPGEDS